MTRIEATILEFGVALCREAYEMNVAGNGGRTIGSELTGRECHGDRLIDAGRWLYENLN